MGDVATQVVDGSMQGVGDALGIGVGQPAQKLCQQPATQGERCLQKAVQDALYLVHIMPTKCFFTHWGHMMPRQQGPPQKKTVLEWHIVFDVCKTRRGPFDSL